MGCPSEASDCSVVLQVTLLANIRDLYSVLTSSERRSVLLIASLSLVISLFEIAQVGLVFPLVATFTNPELLESVPVYDKLRNAFGLHETRGFLLFFLGLMIVLAILRASLNLLFLHLQSLLLSSGGTRIAKGMYTNYLFAPLLMLQEKTQSEMLYNIRTVGMNIFNLSVPGLLGSSLGLINIVVLALLIITVNPLAFFITATLVVGLVVLQQALSGQIFRRLGEERVDLGKRLNWFVISTLEAMKEIKVLQRQDDFVGRFTGFVTRELINTRKYQFYSQSPGVINDAIITISLAVLVATFVAFGDLNTILPQLAVFFVASARCLPAANRITIGLNHLKNGAPSVEIYKKEMREFAQHVDLDRLGGLEAWPFEHSIVFENVSYQYPNANAPSIHNVSFQINKGEIVGVVGASGAGKTTIANLILGLLVPTEGRILVDGVDISTNISGWQSNLGFVPQHVVAIEGSAVENVAFHFDPVMIDEDRVVECLKRVKLYSRIMKEERGLASALHDRGSILSGGELQRLGIARALYQGAHILLLDEATSALDSTTESVISELIMNLSNDITVVIIAHRLSTLRNADRLLYFKEGRLAAQGSFEEIRDCDADFKQLLKDAEFFS